MLGKQLQTAAAGNAAGEVLGIEDVFSTWLYTGTGSTQTITNGIDLSGEGGLVFGGHRNGTSIGNLDRWFYDTARGTGQALYPSSTNGQGYDANGISSFNSDGFTLPSGNARHNDNGYTYASWTFRKAEKFFDVVTYTGTSAPNTVNHNLGAVPGTIIFKNTTDSGTSWIVWHRSLGGNDRGLKLESDTSFITNTNYFNNTAPTSTNFTVGNHNWTNGLGDNIVAYLFAHDAGGFGDDGTESVIKCGSFTTNSSGIIPTVDLGWEPQWLLLKRTDSTSQWYLYDTMRGIITGGNEATLYPNLSNAEIAGANTVDLLPNGFVGGTDSLSGATSTFVYIAIRRGPMKTPRDATDVFAATSFVNTTPQYTTGFPVDLAARRYGAVSTAGYPINVWPRLTNKYMSFNETVAETPSAGQFDIMNGWSLNGETNNIGYFFRRAPGFFDVVAWTNNGLSPQNINHNLGVVPELIIAKRRGSAENWQIYSQATGATAYLTFTTNAAVTGNTNRWNATSPTASVFTTGTGFQTSENYIAYLFATCPGVSKVGSYTGTGTTLDVDCGFTAGARFVLIKRTDSTGDWYVWDTARGVVSGNDPYLLLNSTAAENTSTDYIDPLSSGFQISSAAPAAINASGGSFIFLAVA